MSRTRSFLSWLYQLDRGAMAALRRSLSYPPGRYFPACKYVEPFLGPETRDRTRAAMYLVAGLYAIHQIPSLDSRDNVGYALAKVARQNPDRARGIERRFLILLESQDEQLAYYLTWSVQTLAYRPLDYLTLYFDLLAWQSPSRRVQTRWVRAFYGTPRDNGLKEVEDAE